MGSAKATQQTVDWQLPTWLLFWQWLEITRLNWLYWHNQQVGYLCFIFHLYGNKEVSLRVWPIRLRWFHTFSPCAEVLGEWSWGHVRVQFGSQAPIAINWHSRYCGTHCIGTWQYLSCSLKLHKTFLRDWGTHFYLWGVGGTHIHRWGWGALTLNIFTILCLVLIQVAFNIALVLWGFLHTCTKEHFYNDQGPISI